MRRPIEFRLAGAVMVTALAVTSAGRCVAEPAGWPASPPAIARAKAADRVRLILPVIAFRVEDEPGRKAAGQCAELWGAEAPRMAAELGLAMPDQAQSVARDTVECLVLGTAAFSRLFGNRLPDWGVGVALPGGGVVAVDHARLPAVGRGLREVFLHEMTHALLMRAGGDVPLPAWLHEGLAMRLSGEWRFSDTVTLAMEGRVPDLSDLRGAFPGGAQRAARAYLTSELAVDRLLDTFGQDVVRRLLEAARRTGDFREAFESVTGAPLEVFENRFASAMNLRYGWLVVITRWPALFVLLALVLFVGAMARLARNRRRLAAMDDDDFEPEVQTGQPDAADIAACPKDEG
jgi:hypothetical protein